MQLDLITSGSDGNQALLAHEVFVQQLDDLAQQWRAHHGTDLAIRLRTGELLNQRLGSPATRQSRGDEVLKDAAKQLGIAESDLSRMRSFASQFSSLEELNQKHPEVTTWTAVKDLLPTLKAQSQKQKEGSSNGSAKTKKRKGRKAPKLIGLKQSLSSLSSKLRRVHIELDDAQKEALLEQVRKLAEALEECLKIRVSVEQVSVKSDSPAALQGLSGGSRSAA
jgi:hypothetical protein